MDGESLNPELEGTPCAVSGCYRTADVIGWLTIKISPLVGAVPEDEKQTIEFPLCVDHAHLLRMGGEMIEFDEGLR